VQVPPGVPHTVALPGNRPVRFVNLHTPSCGFGTFLRDLHEARTEEELAGWGRPSIKSLHFAVSRPLCSRLNQASWYAPEARRR
jgi:hypothetical protein